MSTLEEDVSGLVATLRQAGGTAAVCHHCRTSLGTVSGVGLTMLNGAAIRSVVGTDGPLIELLEELQISLGQGPGVEAAQTGRPVLVDDLSSTEATLRWAAFAGPARRHGAEAMFAFPVLSGELPPAVLDLCRDSPGPLSTAERAQATRYAAAAAVLLAEVAPADAVPVENARTRRATGMVMGQIGVNDAVALRRLHRHASEHDRPLAGVVDDVLSGRLRFDPTFRA